MKDLQVQRQFEDMRSVGGFCDCRDNSCMKGKFQAYGLEFVGPARSFGATSLRLGRGPGKGSSNRHSKDGETETHGFLGVKFDKRRGFKAFKLPPSDTPAKSRTGLSNRWLAYQVTH